jgi:predicted kinase
MKQLIKELNLGKQPDLQAFVDAFGMHLDLLMQLKSTEQEPEWHAEGNVFTHTQLVLENIYKILDTEAAHLPLDHRLSLILAAVLHDIAKPLVTKVKEIDGQQKIVAPYHEERAASYLFYRILELGFPYPIIQLTLRLVAYHHMPKRLVMHNALKGEYFKLARMVDLELLYYLAKADMRGRVCKDQPQQCEIIEFFRLYCEEFDLWQKPSPYEAWRIFFNQNLPDLSPESRDAVFGYAIQDFEEGLIFTPEEAIARRYPYLKDFPQLVVMAGPSGAGKSTYVQKYFNDYQVISLDKLREEYSKERSNQKNNSFIHHKARDILKQHLRQKQKIVWDATNLRKDFREIIIQLGLNYHALVSLVVMHMPLTQIQQGNHSRQHQVSNHVFDDQLDKFEWTEDSEAHRIAFVQHDQCLDYRGRC